MNVLVDVHHADLLEAMHRLFEDRLGMTVYVPFGMDWYEYAPYGNPDVAKQFLVDAALHTDYHPRKIRFLTLDEFRGMDFGVICATMAEQQWGFKRLADEKGARFAVQVGNTMQFVDRSLDPLVFGAAGIKVHQEFDKDGAFAFSPIKDAERYSAASFVNIFSLLPGYSLFQAAAALLPGWTFDCYGHHGPQGFVKPTSKIGDLMRSYGFGWHDKETGDGFGHVIHQWAAIGRPLIGHATYYRGQVAEDLWEDMVTCIDLDKHPVAEAVQIMDVIASNPERHAQMGREIRRRLDARIDYAAEAERLGEALGLLVAA